MRIWATSILAVIFAGQAVAQCGGSFGSFVQWMKREAMDQGYSAATVDRFFQGVTHDESVIRADRSQGVFQKNFLDFSRALISQNRIDHGAKNFQRHRATFDRIAREYGVSPGVLLAFWAFETDYGAFQGNFNTVNALVTLAHDCRRPELFRPQVLAAIELYARGGIDPRTTTGAWAGEIGMVQMLPADILENGTDGDGDGVVDLKGSPPDALISGAKMLRTLGWRAGEPWLQEIRVPADLDWSKTGLNTELTVRQWETMGVRGRTGALGPGGLRASVLLPMGRNGPAFLAYPNFRVYFEWNKSFVYVTTAAYFATRLEGAPIYDEGSPEQGLSGPDMEALQRLLEGRGHDVGGVDGILGAKTRAAVQAEQARLGLPADAWPTLALLKALR
ncbi:MAG: lytic murein transglycosylase [Pseudomonadota bacterium]